MHYVVRVVLLSTDAIIYFRKNPDHCSMMLYITMEKEVICPINYAA